MMDSTFMGTMAGMALRLKELGQGRLHVIHCGERSRELLCGIGARSNLRHSSQRRRPLRNARRWLKPAASHPKIRRTRNENRQAPCWKRTKRSARRRRRTLLASKTSSNTSSKTSSTRAQRSKPGFRLPCVFFFSGCSSPRSLGWLFTYQRQRWRIRQLERSNEEIQVEENLVFDFLHGLGRSFSRCHPAARSPSLDRGKLGPHP